MTEIHANAIRFPGRGVVLPFPAERVLYAHGATDQVCVVHRGEVTIYDSPEALHAAWRPLEAERLGLYQKAVDALERRAEQFNDAIDRLQAERELAFPADAIGCALRHPRKRPTFSGLMKLMVAALIGVAVVRVLLGV